MNFNDLMDARHSVRNFKEKQIPNETLEEIVKIASKSPSWENSQPWNVYISTGELTDKIRNEWIKNHANEIKGNPDMPTGHRTDFSERGQKNMASFMEDVATHTEDSKYEFF